MKRLLLIALMLMLQLPIAAQIEELSFHSLTPANGLSQVSVNDIWQDERGRIWIGTRNGLNRYTGNDVHIFRPERRNPYALTGSNIHTICGDNAGSLYLLLDNSVMRMDLDHERFETLSTEWISAIHYHDGLYAASENRIARYDKQKATFIPICTLPNPESRIAGLFIDRSGRIWIGTLQDGVYCLDHSGHLAHPITHGRPTRFYQDLKGNIWIGSWEDGLTMISDAGPMRRFHHSAGDENSLPSDFVRCCCEDNTGTLWIGTFLGLSKFDSEHNTFTTYKTPLTHLSIWCTLKDRQGTIWIGTYFGGVNWFNPEYAIYTHYNVSLTPQRGLSFGVVGKMTENDQGDLWICTEGGGVNRYNPTTKQFKWYRHEDGINSLSHNNVKAAYYDRIRQAMWFGTHLGGLSGLNLKTNRFDNYDMRRGLPSDIVRDIVPQGNDLLLATYDGVARFSPESGKCTTLFRDTPLGRLIVTVVDLIYDKQGNLWIATEDQGVFVYDFRTRRLTGYHHDPADTTSLSTNNIMSMLCDKGGNLWIAGAGTGIDRFVPEKKHFENYDSHSAGLGGDYIYELCDNGDGTLSVTSDGGYTIFDPAHRQSRNFSRHNGFPLAAPNDNAMYLSRNGTLYIGGADGMVSFHKERLGIDRKPYEIFFNRLSVNSHEVNPGDPTGILEEEIAASRKIRLKSQYNSFSVEFATSNYIPENSDPVEFRLRGFSDEWAHAQSNILTYTNLDAGTYALQLRSAAADKPIELEIEILPPFYKTRWAYLLYVLLAGTVTFLFLRAYYGRVRLHALVKYEKNRIHDIEALNQSKLRFFTNISHEFRTPLTLIIGQIESLLRVESLPATVYRRISSVYKSSLQLNTLISELLDFRKQEQGHMKILVRESDLGAFLEDICSIFIEYARTQDITLEYHKPEKPVMVWYDAKQLSKVFNNLIGNAVKHSKSGDRIEIGIETHAHAVYITVSDTGEGIAASDLGHIFERFYQGEKSTMATSQGTGIGLALAKGITELHGGTITVKSKVGEGSTFRVMLPTGKEHFSAEQIAPPSDHEAIDRFVQPILPETGLSLAEEEMDDAVRERVRGATILIVEDNTQLRKMLADLFAPLYNVIEAADGKEGLEKVRETMPQIVLSDVLMPRMSGIELCKQIKNELATCHIPVVLLTARTATAYNLEGLRTGADDYIVKPFNTDLLIARCNNLVNSRIILQEKFSHRPDEQSHQLATNPLDKKLLDKATASVEAHMDDPEFNVNTFVSEMAMARTNLFNKLKAITGLTPNDFILTVRLKHAAVLLRNNPELNVSQISDATGFNSPRYFSKCFRDRFGVNPLAYRNGKSSDEEQK